MSFLLHPLLLFFSFSFPFVDERGWKPSPTLAGLSSRLHRLFESSRLPALPTHSLPCVFLSFSYSLFFEIAPCFASGRLASFLSLTCTYLPPAVNHYCTPRTYDSSIFPCRMYVSCNSRIAQNPLKSLNFIPLALSPRSTSPSTPRASKQSAVKSARRWQNRIEFSFYLDSTFLQASIRTPSINVTLLYPHRSFQPLNIFHLQQKRIN